MNKETGVIFDEIEYKPMDVHIHPHDLTAKMKFDEQERLYSPCVCGSGKKYKFCCRKAAKRKG